MTCWCGETNPFLAALPATCDGCSACERDDDDDFGPDFEAQETMGALGPEGCLFPGECCMPGFHYESECHTPADLEAMWAEREQEKGVTR